jgi:hypothetical protein
MAQRYGRAIQVLFWHEEDGDGTVGLGVVDGLAREQDR